MIRLLYRAMIAMARILFRAIRLMVSRHTRCVRLKSKKVLCSLPYPIFLTIETTWLLRALYLGSTLGAVGAFVSILCTIIEIVLDRDHAVAMVSLKRLNPVCSHRKHNLFTYLHRHFESFVQKLELYADQLQALLESVARLPQDLQQEILKNAPFPTSSYHVSTSTSMSGLAGRVRLAKGKIDAVRSCQNNTPNVAVTLMVLDAATMDR